MSIHLALGMGANLNCITLRKIGNICTTLDQQGLRRFVDEHPYLIPIFTRVNNKYILGYNNPIWMHNFFLDPNRSQYLYSTSLVIVKCQKAIKSIILDPDPEPFEPSGLLNFFLPTLTPFHKIPIANATHLLESARNGSDRNELLLFLDYLSKIHWFNIYNGGPGKRHLTNRIAHWVCTTLVG